MRLANAAPCSYSRSATVCRAPPARRGRGSPRPTPTGTRARGSRRTRSRSAAPGSSASPSWSWSSDLRRVRTMSVPPTVPARETPATTPRTKERTSAGVRRLSGPRCQGQVPSISTSSEKLSTIRISTMIASTPTLSIVGVDDDRADDVADDQDLEAEQDDAARGACAAARTCRRRDGAGRARPR